MGAFTLAALAAACGPAASTPTVKTQAPPAPAAAAPASSPKPTAPPVANVQPTISPTQVAAIAKSPASPFGSDTLYVFNVGSKDVTLVDAATRQVRDTKPLGAAVRWLSNEQPFWDGRHIWTYDFPDNKLQAIAIDPQTVTVARRIEGIGTGPGHSLVVLPDRSKGAVNVAGDNVVALLDLASGQVDTTIKTGAFP